MVQWLKNVPSNAEDTGSVPGQGTKISHDKGQLSPPASTIEKKILVPQLRLINKYFRKIKLKNFLKEGNISMMSL